LSTAAERVKINRVIAVSAGHRTSGPFRAVMMKRLEGEVQLVWKATDGGSGGDLTAFLNRVLPAAIPASSNGSTPAGVLGLDCAEVAFYRVEVPAVADHQVGPILRMQAESLLPLPMERMQVAWRAEAAREGKRRCSVAAGRSDQLGMLALDAGARTSRIILNAEAVVKAWTELFESVAGRAAVIYMRPHDTQILLVDGAVLRHAVVADVGSATIESAGEMEIFVHDVRGALELFDGDVRSETPVFVMGVDAEGACGEAIAALGRARITAELSRPASNRLRYADTGGESSEWSAGPAGQVVDAADILDYVEPIGLGLMALDEGAEPLNLFEGLLAASQARARSRAPALIVSLLIAAIVLVGCLAARRAVDEAALERLTDLELNRLIEQQKTRQLIASQRPDVLEIIAIITEQAPSGMLLDGFEFKQGGPVVITSFAKSREELYEFEKKMESHKDISQVRSVNPTLDEKQNRINFKMEFNYKNFSEKR